MKAQRDELERDMLAQERKMASGAVEDRAAFTEQCFQKVEWMEADVLAEIKMTPIEVARLFLDRTTWKNFDRQANRPA